MRLREVIGGYLFLVIFGFSIFAEDRALVIGINNYQNRDIDEVKGAEEDAFSMEIFLQKKFGFSKRQIKTLIGSQATDYQIRKEVEEWLIKGTKEGDRVFFFFSGHGSRVADEDGDERDERDEVIIPYNVC
jgi:metacaspase-1